MSKYKTVYKEVEVEVEVSLEDFDDEDLLDELESRGGLPAATIGPYDYKELVEQIWIRRRNGQDYNYPLDQLIYQVTGHIV
jgi:hypothetical protein